MYSRSFLSGLAVCLLALSACGDDGSGVGGSGTTSSSTGAQTSTGQGGSGVTTSQSSSSSSSSSTGQGGGGGEGGGGPNTDPGAPGAAFVSSGDRTSSPNFTSVHTTGQPTINSNRMDSANFRLQGGLIGATGSLP